MSDTHWNHALQISGQIGFTLSLISNTILIFLIHFRSNRQIGSYKYILMLFCVFTMFYSCVEMFLRPFLHIYDDTLFLIQRKYFDLGKTVTRVLSTTYCFCYAMSFTLFALQFLYRYIATCKAHLLHYFSGAWFLLWITATVSIALSWQIAAFFLFPQNARTEQSFRFICQNSYGIDASWADYMPYKYFYRDEFNERHPDYRNLLGILQHLIVIFGSFGVLFYCGFRTYSQMKSFKGVSNKTRHLQYQLFRALVVQTIFPMLFMYFPTGFLFACPILGWELGANTNYQVVITQLYPGIDPMIVLMLISDYRRSLWNIICLRKSLRPGNNSYTNAAGTSRITPATTLASTDN